MSPDRKAIILTSPLLAISIVAAFSHLGGLRISDIETTATTPAIESHLLPLKGLPYLSSERSDAIKAIEELGYIEGVGSSIEDGTLRIVPEYKADGIVVLSGNGAFVVYPGEAVAVDLKDVPYLISVYPYAEIGNEEMDFFISFGFDYDFFAGEAGEAGLPSSIHHALDDNVSDKGAVSKVLPPGFEG